MRHCLRRPPSIHCGCSDRQSKWSRRCARACGSRPPSHPLRSLQSRIPSPFGFPTWTVTPPTANHVRFELAERVAAARSAGSQPTAPKQQRAPAAPSGHTAALRRVLSKRVAARSRRLENRAAVRALVCLLAPATVPAGVFVPSHLAFYFSHRPPEAEEPPVAQSIHTLGYPGHEQAWGWSMGLEGWDVSTSPAANAFF